MAGFESTTDTLTTIETILDDFATGGCRSWERHSVRAVSCGLRRHRAPGYCSDANVANGTVFGFFDEDTTRVIKTFVYAKSPTDINVPIFVGGDDGHTITLNGTTIFAAPTGGPFGQVTLDFHPGVNEIEAAVYNGPGLSLIQLTTNSTDYSLGQISAIPGLYMNANGNFAGIPEPSTFVLAVCGVVTLLIIQRRMVKAVEGRC